MATNKKSSSSKTARVMNLLSKNREDAQPAEQAPVPAATANPEEASAPAAQAPSPTSAPPAPAHPSSTPPILTAMQADSAISHQVMSALESALNDELGAQQAQETAAPGKSPVAVENEVDPVPETTVEAAADPVAEPVQEITPTPVIDEPDTPQSPAVDDSSPEYTEAPVAAAEDAALSAPEEAASEPPVAETAPEENASDEPPVPETAESKLDLPTQLNDHDTTSYVNVMETLVEEKTMKYIEMFNLCKCQRCVTDVKAYALNHLNPKYVVMRSGDMVPRITVYEGQYSAAVTAQILTACRIVMDNPRHDL